MVYLGKQFDTLFSASCDSVRRMGVVLCILPELVPARPHVRDLMGLNVCQSDIIG